MTFLNKLNFLNFILSIFSGIKSLLFLIKRLYFFTNTIYYTFSFIIGNCIKVGNFYTNHTLNFKIQSVISLMAKISSLHLEDYRFDPYITLHNHFKNIKKTYKNND